MNKSRQKALISWLKAQRKFGKIWLKISVLLGIASGLTILLQAWLIATLLQASLIEHRSPESLSHYFIALIACFICRALLFYLRENVGFRIGLAVRSAIRQQLLQRLEKLGPSWVASKPLGQWSLLIQEQIENLQDYYARYLPQMSLAMFIPLLILITLFPVNWAAALILLATAPLIPLFMAMVGMGAAEANRRNFQALARLGGDFLDRLRGLDTLRLFDRKQAETQAIKQSSEQFRQRTMEVLRLAFLSSAVLEFFTAISIAIIAVYFGFSYLGVFNFGHYHHGVTLFAGFLALVLAPEFFQPLRDLGTFYHAKAQAIGAADEIESFLHQSQEQVHDSGAEQSVPAGIIELQASDLEILTPQGQVLAGPLNFRLAAGDNVAIVGPSGAGKSSLINALLGFLPYRGSLLVNGLELSSINPQQWHQHISWLGQQPNLMLGTLRENIVNQTIEPEQLSAILTASGVTEFLPRLADGLETMVYEDGLGLSVGQAQRIALARALVKSAPLMLLDEPTASLDSHHANHIMQTLRQAAQQQTTLLVTHQLDELAHWQQIWVIDQGNIVQQGDLPTLINSPGLFRTLWLQRQGDID